MYKKRVVTSSLVLIATLMLSYILICLSNTSTINIRLADILNYISTISQEPSALLAEAGEQTDNFSRIVLGYDFFVVGFLIIIVLFNIFYFIIRKEKCFIIYVFVCFYMIGVATLNGSHLISYCFPRINVMTLIYLNSLAQLLLPIVLLAIASGSMKVTFSIQSTMLYGCFSILSPIAMIFIPITAGKWITVVSWAIILLICINIIEKVTNGLIKNRTKKFVAFIVLFGNTIFIACILADIYQVIRNENNFMSYLPAGFIIMTMAWECYYSYTYEQMLKNRLEVLEKLNLANEKERELEMKYLKSQIRPHFINNALTTIIAISQTNSERATKLLYEFCNYLRGCYNNEWVKNTVSIDEEISFVQSYVALEKARFDEKLDIKYIIDDVVLDIPPLILQPLVENAIQHNTISKDRPLKVVVYVIKQFDMLKIGVQDNGKGFDLENVKSIISGEQSTCGVGINNINQRLKRIYNTELHIENCDEGGSDVYMLIPYNESRYNV